MALDLPSFGDWREKIRQAIEDFVNIVTRRDPAFNKVVFSKDNSLMVGAIYYFQYDPKYKDILMEYDKLPLSIYLGESETPGNKYGFNIHFLEEMDRRELLQEYSYVQNGEIRFNVMAIQERFKNTLCFREYIFATPYLKGPPQRITRAGVESIISLPSAIVVGGGYEKVRKMVRNRRRK